MGENDKEIMEGLECEEEEINDCLALLNMSARDIMAGMDEED